MKMKSKQKYVILSLLLSFLFFWLNSICIAQTNWTNVCEQPVFEYGASGEWDSAAVFRARVIKDGDTLRMWYSGSNSEGMLLGKIQIGYAWSLDGIDWHRYKRNPVITGDLSWEYGVVGAGPVILDGDTLKMWYNAAYGIGKIIGYATSTDGINWKKHPDPVLERGPAGDWDDGFIEATTVIKEDGLYKMWYWGANNVYIALSVHQIGYATSTDGIHWEKYDFPLSASTSDPVLKVGSSSEWDAQRAWSPAVFPTEDGYEMLYTGTISTYDLDDRIGYATSSDGEKWKKWPANPIITTHPCWGIGYSPDTILKFNSSYHLWYSSFTLIEGVDHRAQIGYATSMTTKVEIDNGDFEIPIQHQLYQNFPNPFNAATTIRFIVAQPTQVAIKIYNTSGQLVRIILNERKQTGEFSVNWDGRDDSYNMIGSGIYFCKMEIAAKNHRIMQTKKLIYLK